nr:dapper homolog 2 [Oryctolagus cuniculus]
MWAPGGPPGPLGWDRRRVGARLRAALAGLHELQGLRATQQARVRGALAMQPSPEPAAPCGPRAPELRLEAALAALQEQLSRLRRQDAGLKTHLDQLGQQISELQLDVCRSSCEAPDSDSRPSSGFYELSDGGSCSLSTSCASVCSDRISPSLGSLLPAFQASKDRPAMGDWRPRSADETTVPAWRPQPTEEGGGPPSSAEDPVWPRGMFRPRPVSTGDLERVLPEDVGLQEVCGDRTAAPHLCQGVEGLSHVLDPKYQRDLVSRGGLEVYPYPSPLHAVALQSPLFALTRDTPQTTSHMLPPALPPPSTTRTGPAPEVGLAGTYIDRLLRRHSQRASVRGGVRDQGPPRWAASPSPQKLGHAPQAGSNAGSPSRDSLGQQGPGPHGSPQHPSPLPQEDPRPPDGRVPRETVVGATPRPQTQQPPRALDCSRGPGVSPARKVQERPPVAWGHHVPGPGADSKASPGGMATSHPQPKAVKVRRRASDKGPRPARPPLPSERPRGAPVAARLPLEWGPSCRPSGAGLRRKPTPGGAAPGRSCSESTLYPVPFFVPLVVARPNNWRASAQVLFPVQSARKQRRRWQSAVEIAGRRGQRAPRATCARDGESDAAESSEDDASGLSAGCFGDAEASGSDAESGRGRRTRTPAPRLCRVKASRALRRKIRRFQPAALRVMTMV